MEEWQHTGNNDWIFGMKVRGLVRDPRAEIYFNDSDGPTGGWVWMAWPSGRPGRPVVRGVEEQFQDAAIEAERALGIMT